MSSQIERGTALEMVRTIAFRAGVLERILQRPVLGGLEIRADELAYVQLLQQQIDDLCRYLNLPSIELERTAKVKLQDICWEDSRRYKEGMCASCGRSVYDHAKYCDECGCRLEWDE